MRLTLCAASLAALLLPAPARAQGGPRLDHNGAVGLSLAAGWEHPGYLPFTHTAKFNDANFATLELQGTANLIGYNSELVLTLRAFYGPVWAGAVAVDFRKYSGIEQWKTFYSLGLKGDTAPGFVAGPHADFGVIYELSSFFGLFAKVGGSLEAGQGLRGAFEANLGIQGRSFLLE